MTEDPRRVTAGIDYSLVGDEHVRRYEETGGEVGYLWNDAPTLILTTTGRTSGRERKTPLIFATDGERYVIVASQGGAPTNPGWFHNISANPLVRVQIKTDRFDAVARAAEGAERERLWSLVNETWPSYDLYQSRTQRVIPVVVLERTAS